MKLYDAYRLKPGDEVSAPRAGIAMATVVSVEPQPENKRVLMLITVQTRNGCEVLNYRLVHRRDRAED